MAIRFTPVRSTEAKILAMDREDGKIYFATDTGKIYLDTSERRISVGGSGSGGGGNSSILYAKSTAITEHSDGYYYIAVTDLEDSTVTNVPEDTLVINQDGAFYRVVKYENETLYCTQIAVSGGGSSSLAQKIYVDLEKKVNTSNYINGKSAYAIITPHSGLNSEGTKLETQLTVTWRLATKVGSDYVTYATETLDLEDNETYELDFGSRAKESATSYLFVEANGIKSGASESMYFSFTTMDLTLEKASSFTNTNVYSYSNIVLSVNVTGNMAKIVDYYWDGTLIHSDILTASSDVAQSCKVNTYVSSITHGYHTVRVELYQSVQGVRGVGTDPIEMEIAVNAGEQDAIIWLGDYDTQYYSYDDINIPYFVYNPANLSGFTVDLLKSNAKIAKREFSDLTSGLVSATFEITDAEIDIQNYYSIVCGDTRRDIYFTVIKDPTRDMNLQQSLYLKMNFDAKGRSNDESATSRETLVLGEGTNTVSAVFDDFNWYNNGWVKGTDNNTCLRISNGARFSIPIGAMTFANASDSTKQSHTFEFQFRIRNVQNYDSLIKNITRYKGDAAYYNEFYGYISYDEDTDNVYNINANYFILNNEEYVDANISDETSYETVKSSNTVYIGTKGYKTKYNNYDAFLKYYADLNNLDLDTITAEYDYTEKRFDLSAIACGFYSGKASAPIGFGLGPQDAFFTNGTNTVNASYVEDKLVNLSITYNHSNKLMSIYVNGILTGVVFSTLDDPFTINNSSIVFSSGVCDIDLYKFRVYDYALSLNDVVTNYAVDLKDVLVYDQNAIAVENNAINEYQFNYTKMLEYNSKHPSEPIMPYIIFDTSNSDNEDRLSWSKSTKVNIQVEFVNTVLDRAYESGELEDLASQDGVSVEEYYLHHCPSFASDWASMAVQGTSSEFYPRRNYKIKMKDSNKDIHFTANRGPFAEENQHMDWFYMDNYSKGTNVFTMKIDFMESSGSYNRGLANLLKNAYSKHPLDYYAAAGVLTSPEDAYVVATSFEEGTTYYYYNHKGNIKAADGSDDNIPTLTEEMFNLGPVACYEQLMASNTSLTTKKVITDTSSEYYNKWYTGGTTYKTKTDFDFDELRTTVQGFPVLAFHKKSDGTYTYIGRYNMLSDKSSNEMYGLKSSGAYAGLKSNKDISKIAEGWEFENNQRGFCSFRDPLKRKHLSFNTNTSLTDTSGWDEKLRPTMLQDFEYRYTALGDTFDIICEPTIKNAVSLDNLTAANIAQIKSDTKVTVNNENPDTSRQVIFDLYGNWEKACQWVWSTCLDAPFVKTDAEIAAMTDEEKQNYLIDDYFAVADDAEFDSTAKYYKYKLHLYEPYAATEETWEADKASTDFDLYELKSYTVTYGETTYTYDTYEYRCAKFRNELTDHFNMDYLATYFVVTEVLELYDSRGKNCMMVSWGPQEDGGDYIWFPIFYDMDTQLGINNTGIPSFEYYIDATDEGSFSTNDSVLWNNFYKLFTDQITQKYCQLKGNTEGIGEFIALDYAPFTSVSRIEGWYQSDPTICKSIVMRGVRPLSAINLDEYYKYISITNGSGPGYQGQSGGYLYDNTDTANGTGSPKGSYFYALQGDRALSRQQFLTNRINYLESWLGVGSYEKSGSQDTSFWGRIKYNALDGTTSDVWVDTTDETWAAYKSDYYEADGKTKVNEFDGEYWMTVTPSRKSYVRLIADDVVSKAKYTDSPVTVELQSLKDAAMTSPQFKEQLLYILGVDIIQDLGNLHNLYFTELHTINAPNLTRLVLGWDGVDDKGNTYYSHKTNPHTFSSMPLLKELNLSNIQYKDDAEKTLDFSSSEKLQNFRATGSNFTQIKFAAGVALDTLYLPSTITELKLTEARQLKNVITTYEIPVHDKINDTLTAKEGLYIEHFTEYLDDVSNSECLCGINTLSIVNASGLGYDGYKLLKGYYNKRKLDSNKSAIQMTEVDWTPYKKVDSGSYYNSNNTYVVDNFHYGFNSYTYTTKEQWETDIANGVLYVLKTDLDASQVNNIAMLEDMVKNSLFTDTVSASIPNITGTIYIDNDTKLTTTTSGSYTDDVAGRTYTWSAGDEVDEYYVRNVLNKQYPGITFFFKTITQNNTARFILYEEPSYEAVTTSSISQTNIDTGYYFLKTGEETYLLATNYDNAKTYYKNVNKNVYQTIGLQTIKTGWFDNPIDIYGDISESKANYDFSGWSSDIDGTNVLINNSGINEWTTNSYCTLVDGTTTYNIYAVFIIHQQNITFIDDENTYISKQTYSEINSVEAPDATEFIPYKSDAALDVDKTYAFVGWSNTPERIKVVDLSSYRVTKDYTFYAVFEEQDVHSVDNSDLFNFTAYKYSELTNVGGDSANDCQGYKATPKGSIKGKVTIPATYTENGTTLPVVAIGGFESQSELTHVFFATGSELKEVSDYAFCENSGSTAPSIYASKLKYFEFIDSIRYIGTNGFRNVPLEVYTLPSQLYCIGVRAFLGAFASTSPITIVLGNELTCMSYYSIANNSKLANGCSIIIGTSLGSSKLNLSLNLDTSTSNRYKRINDNNTVFASCIFNSANYSSITDIACNVNGNKTVADCIVISGGSGDLKINE